MDRHVRARLKNEKVIWFVTSGRNGRPQAVPVWFHWDGDSLFVMSQDGVKVRNIRQNPYVQLHLNSDEAGDDVVRISGRATILKSRPPGRARAYLRKYRQDIRDLGGTVEGFEKRYRFPVRVTRLRYH